MKAPIFFALVLVIGISVSCKKNPATKNDTYGAVRMNIRHSISGNDFVKDTLQYANVAGNRYLISEIQWFLSNVIFEKSDGTLVKSGQSEDIYYVDTDIPENCSVLISNLPVGDYKSIQFTFGLDEITNTSFRFVNPPESFMFWPEYLGGGYHYMKLNGKWLNTNDELAPFNFHLGIGQLSWNKTFNDTDFFDFGLANAYEHCEGFAPPFKLARISQFVQNYFISSQEIEFTIVEQSNTTFSLEMQVDKWFDSDQPFNFDSWGGSIMQQQPAQEMARLNGQKVFRISLIN